MTEERKEQYKTLLIICGGFALIGWRLHHVYLVVIAAVLLVLGLASVYMLGKIAEAWMWIGEKIGAVMSRVILSIVFIFFLTPVSLLYRSFGRKSRKQNKESYFVQRNHTYTAADLEKIF
jgi:multisubunit Na+/H+ antiporter MnhG subunit